MSLGSFLKKLVIFDVFWGRRSKIFKGVKDGGAKATSIGDSTKAILWNGSTIFNINDPDFEAFGGHTHDFNALVNTPALGSETTLKSEILNCLTTDQVGDWVVITSNNTVAKVSNNNSGHIFGVICEKITTTTCKVLIKGLGDFFSGLDPTSLRYFLSTSGGMTDTAPSTGYVIDLGRAINSTKFYVDVKLPLRRSNLT